MMCKRCGEEIADHFRFCPNCGKKQCREAKLPKSKKKHRNGDGSIRLLPSEKYQARIMTGGHALSLGTYVTESAAAAAIRSYDDRKALAADKYNYTLGQVYQAYLASTRYARLSDKGKEGISMAWSHLCTLQGRKMRDLTKADYEALIMSATTHKRYKERTADEVAAMKPSERARYNALCAQKASPLSRESRMKIRNLVKLICEEAIGSNIITTNYGDLVSVDGEVSKAHGVFSHNMIDRLFAHTDNDAVKLVLIYIYMGWRAEALLQMIKADVHLDPENNERGDYPHGYCVGGIKTAEGRNREVPIHEKIRPFIEYFMATPGDWLIVLDGKHPSYDRYLRKYFPEALALCGIPTTDEYGDKITPHSTRNTFALMLYQSGVKPEDIAKLIGHTDFDVTNKKYIRNRQSREFTVSEFSKMVE